MKKAKPKSKPVARSKPKWKFKGERKMDEQKKQDQKPNAFPSDVNPKKLDPSKPLDPTHHPTSTAGAHREDRSAKTGEENKDELGKETDKRAPESEEYTGPGSTNRSLGNTAQPFTKQNLKDIEKQSGGVVSDTTEAEDSKKEKK